ncbi:MAG TPA: carboxypeptidase M32 [Fimbriimonadaceae bacterium]|nr:carboxypeptidase M32 [Fimbriimonadaceae bacterium]
MSSTLESSPATDALKQRFYDIDAITSAGSIMSWDQQCFMPRGAAEARSHHLAILGRMAHEMFVADETARLIEDANKEAAPGSVDEAMVRVTKRGYDLATKIPSSLVAEKLQLATMAHEEWMKARKNNDFKSFAPTLERMFEICRQEAEHLGYGDHIYDALLDLYEEGAKKKDAEQMFSTVRQPLVDLVKDIKSNGRSVDNAFLTGDWPEAKQRAFTEEIVKAIGYDFNRGRQDTAPHPFCTNWSVTDVRITTRFLPFLGSAVFGSLHEAGHGMYEQGSPMEWDRTPIVGGVSLGVHESQSRFWENIVGRSKEFWVKFLPDLKKTFPILDAVSLDDFHRAVNKVEPSLIRVEADEVTYNLHILIRFELECALLEGNLKIADLPDAWNAKYTEYLGVTPTDDANGCLQDVHWSGGMVGYFPTYSMGNLLSYQFLAQMVSEIGDQKQAWSQGEFAPTLKWLQEKIYRQGKRYTPSDLVERVTGKPMGADDYLAGITAKYRAIYEI